MPPRDPELTARNRIIAGMTVQLKQMLPSVLSDTGLRSDQSVHAIYGGKFADYIDMKNEVIHSPDHFVSLYLEGFRDKANERPDSAHGRNFRLLRNTPSLQQYLYVFLKRVYMRNIEALSKRRPLAEDAAIWIGQNNADYGLLVTPRFSEVRQQWENDRSEIRHFEPLYWSIGHVLRTGLVIPSRNEIQRFSSVEDYLGFFVNVLVRNSGSQYEYAIAQMYREYVLSTPDPNRVPLLIPELRYDGFTSKHQYRLDFTIIEPVELSKVGFELSPWSSHGYLSKTKALSQAEINEMARDNFEREMRRHKAYFRRYGIFTLIYTDTDLADLSSIFQDMKQYLAPKTVAQQLRFHVIRDILQTN
jgi:hypothetical protein